MFVFLFVALTLIKMANINNARYNITPFNPIRLAQMMRLARMAQVLGDFGECKYWARIFLLVDLQTLLL